MDEQVPPGKFRIYTDDGPVDVELTELDAGDQIIVAYLGGIVGALDRLANATDVLASAAIQQIKQGEAMASSMGAFDLLAKGPKR